MRLLVINPNTTEAVTETIAAAARKAASPGTEIVAITAPFGAAYIMSRSENAIAAHAVLQGLATNADGIDAALIGAFTDAGLAGARELLAIPVVGMAEAAILTACMLGSRFSIVTLAPRAIPMLREVIAGHGLAARIASVRAPAGLQPGGDPEEALGALAACARTAIHEDGADAIILGGAPFAGMTQALAGELPVPVIDGIACGVRQAELLAGLGLYKRAAGSYAHPGPRETAGIDEALAALLAADPARD